MAEQKKRFDAEYVKYMNDQAALFSELDGVHYDYNNPEQMEKRLLEGAMPAAPVKKQPQPQPIKQEKPRIKSSRLGLIVSGFDLDF